MSIDWLVRVCAPAWLDLVKLTQHATALRTAEEIRDAAGARHIQPILDATKTATHATECDVGDIVRVELEPALLDAVREILPGPGLLSWPPPGALANSSLERISRVPPVMLLRLLPGTLPGILVGSLSEPLLGPLSGTLRSLPGPGLLLGTPLGPPPKSHKATTEMLQASSLELLDRMIEA